MNVGERVRHLESAELLTAAPTVNLSVASANTIGTSNYFARADHGHAITTSSNPGGAASILATAAGCLRLLRLGIGVGCTNDNQIAMVNGASIGIPGNELLTFNAAGIASFTGCDVAINVNTAGEHVTALTIYNRGTTAAGHGSALRFVHKKAVGVDNTALIIGLRGAAETDGDLQFRVRDAGAWVTAIHIDGADGGRAGFGVTTPQTLIHGQDTTDGGILRLDGPADTAGKGGEVQLFEGTVGADGFKIRYDGGTNLFSIFPRETNVDQLTRALIITRAAGHVYPGSNKAQDLGLAGSRWRTIYSANALNTGTSRLIESTRVCPVCDTPMVRGTGGLCVVGETEDYMLAFCPNCGVVAMEPIRHLPESQMAKRKVPPRVELVGMRISQSSGLSRQVFVDFRYSKDIMNSTILSEQEIAVFFALSGTERKEFLFHLGEREWYASEEVRLMEETVAEEQAVFDAAIVGLQGTDLASRSS